MTAALVVIGVVLIVGWLAFEVRNAPTVERSDDNSAFYEAWEKGK
jgi:hypothetical protein